ncbi:MAG: hypothetical protein AAF502_25165 [Bacteroidota bacterium]
MTDGEKRDYKKEYSNRKVYVLLHECKVVGAWGNMRKLCEDMKKVNPGFPSYWTLIKLPKESPIVFKAKTGEEYEINIEKVLR